MSASRSSRGRTRCPAPCSWQPCSLPCGCAAALICRATCWPAEPRHWRSGACRAESQSCRRSWSRTSPAACRAHVASIRALSVLLPLLCAVPLFSFALWGEPLSTPRAGAWRSPASAARDTALGLDIGDHRIFLDDFRGQGLPIVLRTLWSYEPALLLLLAVAAATCLVRLARRRSNLRAPILRRDLWVVLAFAVPYALVLVLYERTYALPHPAAALLRAGRDRRSARDRAAARLAPCNERRARARCSCRVGPVGARDDPLDRARPPKLNLGQRASVDRRRHRAPGRSSTCRCVASPPVWCRGPDRSARRSSGPGRYQTCLPQGHGPPRSIACAGGSRSSSAWPKTLRATRASKAATGW